ncbi:salicylic acid-binding protein 2-like [Carica papaya]|uniref:salicylic acid-binding protein 2-like n=1 Tax=Carica papaya TaxID=3649 RepID=UPI000B8D1814|nr:salicylic acid-binding protein 2-like [Carica papaya]
MEKKEIHFVLVHGACHGAWCWYKVASLLKEAGYKVTALDMAGSGVHPKQLDEIHTISDYVEPLMEFMASILPEEKVVLVGHSMGGICISAAIEKFPHKISVAVFVTAIMPSFDLGLTATLEECFRRVEDHMDSQYMFDDGNNKPPTSVQFGPNFLSSKLYQLSPPEDLLLATMLMRPAHLFLDPSLTGSVVVTKERFGSVQKVYIICKKDRVLKEDFQRWMIEKNQTDEVMLIFGSDHMVMFSKPIELCSCLKHISDKYS